jgi:hypothetical protein
MVDVSVEAMAGGDGLIKLSDQAWELNVIAPLAELRKLRDIENTDWAQRRTLKVGTCLDAPVWWNEADGHVCILVGADDEVWQVAITVPASAVREIIALAEKELQSLNRHVLIASTLPNTAAQSGHIAGISERGPAIAWAQSV